MKFVYSLQVVLFLMSTMLGVWNFANWIIKASVFILVFIVHELLHISVVYNIGDISLTHSGIFNNYSNVFSAFDGWICF